MSTTKKSTTKKIAFNATLTGTIDDLDVIIQGKTIDCTDYKVKFNDNLSDATLTVVFKVSGSNGTDFTIKYDCKSDGTAKSDPDNPTDVAGTIDHNDFTKVTLKISL